MYSGKLVLRNNFHNTEATVIVKNGIIEARALKRAEDKLCGCSDCMCGGIRGPQDAQIEKCWGETNGKYAEFANVYEI